MNEESRVIVIVDLGYGDAGKGGIVDYLSRTANAHTVVRYNGGAQAAHNVLAPDGRAHTFSQFGSGTFVPRVRTHLSRFMMIHPLAMLAEERRLRALNVRDAFARTTIDRQALITTPFHQSANRLKEIARGSARHGSCGMGIGETMSDWLAHGRNVLFAGDLRERATTVKKLLFLRDLKIAQLEEVLKEVNTKDEAQNELKILFDPNVIEATADIYRHFSGLASIVEPEYLGRLLNQDGATIFEGAQGVLLDEWYGFYPYNSWSALTCKNADLLLRENSFRGETFKLGLTRAYATRHGAGPFVTEDMKLTDRLQDAQNVENLWQGKFRAGYLDLVALRYALAITEGIDGMVVTNLDRIDPLPQWLVCDLYQYPGETAELHKYFESKGRLVGRIKIPLDPTDLIKQETLTRLLMGMKPIYSECKKNRESFLALVSETLNLPIALISFGPTALSKEMFHASIASFSRSEITQLATRPRTRRCPTHRRYCPKTDRRNTAKLQQNSRIRRPHKTEILIK